MNLPFLQHREEKINWAKFCDWSVLMLLAVAVLWRGGKSLEMTWILVGVACFCTMHGYVQYKRSKNDKVSIPLILWGPLMLFVALTILSFFSSSTSNYGLDEVLRTGALALLFLWMLRRALQERHSEDFFENLIKVIAIVTVAACGIGVLVYLLQPVNRFVGTFFDQRFHTDYWPNAWADFILLAWPIVLFWALRDFFRKEEENARARLELLVRTGVVGFVLGCFFLSYSRGAIIALSCQTLLWVALLYRRMGRKHDWKRTIPVVILIASVSFITFLGVNTLRSQYYEVQSISQKVTFTADEGGSSAEERRQFWQQALTLTGQRPILGWGPYSFRFIQPRLQTAVLATSDHPHNILLKFAVERGVVAAMAFAFFAGFILLRTLRALASKEAAPELTTFSLRLLLFLAVVGLLIHNMIDYNVQFVGIGVLLWIFLALLSVPITSESRRRVPERAALIVEMLLAITLLLVAFYEGGYLAVSSMGRHAEARGDPVTALRWYDRSAGEFFSRDLHLSRANIHFGQGDLVAASGALDDYFLVNGEDARAWKRRGDIALQRSDTELALQAFEKAYALAQYNDLSISNGLIDTYLAMDAWDRLKERRSEFDVLLNLYSEAIERNTHFIALGPNVDELVSLSDIFSVMYRKDAPRYQVMSARSDHKAKIERQRIEARPPGFLW